MREVRCKLLEREHLPGYKTSLSAKGDGSCSYNAKLGRATTYTAVNYGRNRYYGPSNHGSSVNNNSKVTNDATDRALTNFTQAVALQDSVCNWGGDNDR
jgi:ribosome modulation factor